MLKLMLLSFVDFGMYAFDSFPVGPMFLHFDILELPAVLFEDVALFKHGHEIVLKRLRRFLYARLFLLTIFDFRGHMHIFEHRSDLPQLLGKILLLLLRLCFRLPIYNSEHALANNLGLRFVVKNMLGIREHIRRLFNSL